MNLSDNTYSIKTVKNDTIIRIKNKEYILNRKQDHFIEIDEKFLNALYWCNICENNLEKGKFEICNKGCYLINREKFSKNPQASEKMLKIISRIEDDNPFTLFIFDRKDLESGILYMCFIKEKPIYYFNNQLRAYLCPDGETINLVADDDSYKGQKLFSYNKKYYTNLLDLLLWIYYHFCKKHIVLKNPPSIRFT